MKLKVGDKVRIKNNLKGTNKRVGLVPIMKECCSRTATVVAAWYFDEQTPVVRLDIGNLCMWEYDSFVEIGEEWD